LLCCLALTHRYGREGGATKRFDDTCLLFDFEFMEHLCSLSAIQNYKEALALFLQAIHQMHSGTSIGIERKNHLKCCEAYAFAFFMQIFLNIRLFLM